jgi:GT2 family glycosyltransferase
MDDHLKPLFSISIVLYENDPEEIGLLIQDIINSTIRVKLYLLDNSASAALNYLGELEQVEYNFNGANLGYGKAHNLAIHKSISAGFPYHLVMNPDIRFQAHVLKDIYDFMEQHQEVGQLMPKILYQDGEIQRLCKLLPTPFDLIGRRFCKNTAWAKSRNEKYELNHFNYDRIINTPSLSGCFMFMRNEVLEKAGGFDPRYFMYLEDYDLTRRMHALSKTIFYPKVDIYHGYQKESYKSMALLKYHVVSAIKYFNKWGWINDPERKVLNENIWKQTC